MFLHTIQDIQRMLGEIVDLTADLQQATPEELAQWKIIESAVGIAVRAEQLKLNIEKKLNQIQPR